MKKVVAIKKKWRSYKQKKKIIKEVDLIGKKRNYGLDFLKIVATILIVFHHYQQVLNVEFAGINFFGGKFYFGYLVELFFLISGFLMFKYIERIKQGLTFKEFFFKE